MLGLNAALYSSLGALQASGLGLATTNHNIANLNTPGFSRQNVNLATNLPVRALQGFVGTGVKVDSISSFRDRFIETRLNQETALQGRLAGLTDGLSNLEAVFNEGETSGLANSLTAFFNSFSAVANSPRSLAARSTLVQTGRSLATGFNEAASRLLRQRQQADQEIGGLVTQVNELATHIGLLNEKISAGESSGVQNDLRDQRGEALRRLSELIDVSAVEEASGSVVVTVGAGRTLVAGSLVKQIQPQQNTAGLSELTLNGATITSEIKTGRLAGLVTVRDTIIPDAQQSLDELAATIAAQVNTQHAAGTGLDGSTGTNFFTPLAGTTGAARILAVEAGVISDLNKIAASGSGAVGDNANALALANLQQQVYTVGGSDGTISQLYGQLVGEVGALAHSARQNKQIQDVVVVQVQQQRDAVSGVSLDEEAVNLIKYQRAFEAAARVIRVIDELTQETINLGR